MQLINLTARFGLELVGVGAVALWAASFASVVPVRVVLGAMAATAFIAFWALVVAPKATNAIPQDLRVVIGSGVLLLAAGGLALAGQREAATAFSIAIVVNTLLLFALPNGTPAALATAAAHRR